MTTFISKYTLYIFNDRSSINSFETRETYEEGLKNLPELKYISLENKAYRLKHIFNSIYKDNLIYNLIYEKEN